MVIALLLSSNKKSGSLEWRCSVRGKINPCSVVVKQTGDELYLTGTVSHTKPARPDVLCHFRCIFYNKSPLSNMCL